MHVFGISFCMTLYELTIFFLFFIYRSSTVSSNGVSSVSNGSSKNVLVPGSAAGDVNIISKNNSAVIINKLGDGPSLLNNDVACPPSTSPKHSFASLVGVKQGSSVPTSHKTPTDVSGVHSSAADSVLVPSVDSFLPSTVGAIKPELSESAGVETNLLPEISEPLSLSCHDDSLITDSSNHESQSSLQLTCPPKGTILLLIACNSQTYLLQLHEWVESFFLKTKSTNGTFEHGLIKDDHFVLLLGPILCIN